MRFKKTAIRATVLLVGMALASSACGGDDGGGSSSSGVLKGVHLTVGSKEFTEQLILGQIAIQALEHAGATVTDKTGINGTPATRKALTTGQIDMYWEYTGTGWTTNLGHESVDAPKDPAALFDAVAKEDAGNGITWFARSNANDAYAIATADSNPAQTMSDFAEIANSNPDDASMCAAAEFLDRSDGLPGVEKAYGFSLPEDNITEVDLGIIYTQISKQDKCKFGEVFATDGRIKADNLRVLTDDKSFFVHYDIAMTMSTDVYNKYPEVSKVLTPIAEKLTSDGLSELNAMKDVDGIPEDAIATQWLQDNGFI